LIVTQDVHDRLVDDLVTAIRRMRTGHASDPSTTMGPLISMDHRASVQKSVESAIADGGSVITGGRMPSEEPLVHGCFFEPTVIADIHPAHAVWRTEIFGPVLAIHRVRDLDEAIAAANDSPYGLAAGIFTTSLATAERTIRELDAGQIAVNLPTPGWDVHEPFGGFRSSGSAFKEQGTAGLQFYTRIKTAAVRFA
jgi:aldehyde dehydrogenase (NAD+)